MAAVPAFGDLAKSTKGTRERECACLKGVARREREKKESRE